MTSPGPIAKASSRVRHRKAELDVELELGHRVDMEFYLAIGVWLVVCGIVVAIVWEG